MLCSKNNISQRKLVASTLTIEELPRTVPDLIADIHKGNHTIPSGRIRKDDIIDIARQYNITLNKTVKKGVTETWVGKPKGMLQLAYE